MNALKRYFEETGENTLRLAERMGVAPSTITRPLRGERNVRLDTALQVEIATDGRVTAEDFLSICVAAKRAKKGADPQPQPEAASP